jgi:hypothetical protein
MYDCLWEEDKSDSQTGSCASHHSHNSVSLLGYYIYVATMAAPQCIVKLYETSDMVWLWKYVYIMVTLSW